MRRTVLLSTALLLGLLAAGCGSKEQESPPPAEEATDETRAQTPYGTVAEVGAYLEALNPQIQRVGQLQAEYEQALAAGRQGASGRRGTGRNLAERASQVRPQLLEVLGRLDAIEPPPLLAPFHRDTRKMVVTRLEAYAQTLKGWGAEQARGDFEAYYREAESKLKEANDIILRLNSEMEKINSALQQAGMVPSRTS